MTGAACSSVLPTYSLVVQNFFLLGVRFRTQSKMFERETILVVDDDTEILAAATIRLKAAGYDTLTAADGQAGVAAAEACQPDGILMDVNMPVKDGITALKELKSIDCTKDIPVVIMSAKESNRQAAYDVGAHAFVKKPYQGAKMVQAVIDALEAA